MRLAYNIALLSALLSGCAAQVVSSTPRQVIVNAGKPPSSAATAQKLAEPECKKNNRYARLTGSLPGRDYEYVFECVE